MKLANIQNPYKKFVEQCGRDSLHVPPTSKDSVFGMYDFFEWLDFPFITEEPVLFFISLDGMSSKDMYNLWQNNHLKIPLLSEEITKCENKIILFDNSAEGHCDEYIFKMISQIVDFYKLDKDKVFYGNSCINIKDIFENSQYNNFNVLYTNNFKEDTMLSLIDGNEYTFNEKDYLFSCLNNAPKPHRALFLGALAKYNLLDNPVSTPLVPFKELYTDTLQYLSNQKLSLQEIKQGIEYLDCLEKHYPLSIDERTEDVIHMKTMSSNEGFYDTIFNCDVQIITETFADYSLFITEKIYKPIIHKQPFIILGPSRIYNYLRSQGYKTYGHLFDNLSDYDSEKNIIKKINMLINQLQALTIKKDDKAYWQQVTKQNQIIAEHNFNNFLKNKDFIMENTKKSLNSWILVYKDFKEILEKDKYKYEN